MKNIKILETGIDVTPIVNQLELYKEDWGNAKRTKGSSRQDPHTKLVTSDVLQLVMGGVDSPDEFVGDTEITIPTEAVTRHTEIQRFLASKFNSPVGRCAFLKTPEGQITGKHIDEGKYYLNKDEKNSYLFENGKKTKLNVNSKVSIKNAKIAAAFHGYLSFSKQKKIQKFIKIVNFPCFDALTYAQLAEGRLDIVVQCANKIWDVHAIIPIISAAGGILTTWKNENGKLAGNILASSNKLNHKKILKLLKPAT